MLLIYSNSSESPDFTPEENQAAAQEWYAYGMEAEAAGVLVSNSGLQPVTAATTVRVREGKTLITDGPFAETHEQLGGYYMLDVKDLDEAIRWAAKLPGAKYGSVEVRPAITYTQD
jgi:hypothetical protein